MFRYTLKNKGTTAIESDNTKYKDQKKKKKKKKKKILKVYFIFKKTQKF